MSIEMLRDCTQIDGFGVSHTTDPELNDYVFVDVENGFLAFNIQNGPIKEVGVNGCQVDTIIEAAKIIIEGLNKQFPSMYNEMAINDLNSAIKHLKDRKADREKRGVEGQNKE